MVLSLKVLTVLDLGALVIKYIHFSARSEFSTQLYLPS